MVDKEDIKALEAQRRAAVSLTEEEQKLLQTAMRTGIDPRNVFGFFIDVGNIIKGSVGDLQETADQYKDLSRDDDEGIDDAQRRKAALAFIATMSEIRRWVELQIRIGSVVMDAKTVKNLFACAVEAIRDEVDEPTYRRIIQRFEVKKREMGLAL